MTDTSKPEASKEDAKAEDKKDDVDETTAVVAAQVATQLATPVAQSVAEKTTTNEEEAGVTKTETVAQACEATAPKATADSAVTPVAAIKDEPASEAIKPVQALESEAKDVREKRTNPSETRGDQRNEGNEAAPTVASKTDKTAEVEKPCAKSQEAETGHPSANVEKSAEVSATDGNSTGDRHQDRGERLRDRLSDRTSDVAASDKPQAVTDSGALSIDSSSLITPVVAPEAVAVPTATAAVETIAATVAASAAVAVSEVSSANATGTPGSKLDGKVAASSIGSTGTLGTMDDASSASTMEKASKSRQSEIADRARLIHRISKAFQKLGIDGGQVRLKMHPDDLGTVQLDMKVTGIKVNATVTADSDEAARLLQEHLPDLRQRLESQGLTVDRLQVEQRTDSGSSSFSNQQSFQQQYSAYEEASRRQNQRNNYLPGVLAATAARAGGTSLNSAATTSLGSRTSNPA